MIIFRLLLLFLGLQGLAQTSPEQTVKDFFTAFHRQDTLALKQMTLKDLSLKTISLDKTGSYQINSSSRDQFVSAIGSIPKEMKFEEKILSYETQLDEGFASVWTPYEFFFNGSFSHCGVNQFQLLKSSNGKWLIISIIDTRRSENCKQEK